MTIPKQIRQKYGFGAGVQVEFVDEGNTVRVVKKGNQSPFEKVYGILGLKEKTDALIEAIRGR